MLQHFTVVCSFMIIIVLKYNKVIAAERKASTNNTEVKDVIWGEKKYLVVIEFEDEYRCLAALISSTTLVTSNICLDYYRFTSKVSEKPCKVLAGSKETVGVDLGIWRYCIRADKSLWDDDDVDYTKSELTEIEFDLPFADMEIASVGEPSFEDDSECFVYGFSSEKSDNKSTVRADSKSGPPPEPPPEPQAKFKREILEEYTTTEQHQDWQSNVDDYVKTTEQSEEFSHNSSTGQSEFQTTTETRVRKKATKRSPTSFLRKREDPPKSDGKDEKEFKVVKADVLNLDECKTLYRDNMDTDLPEYQFCVSEGGITDPGRFLICNDVIVGIVADDLAIIKKGENIIYAYQYANAIKPVVNAKVLWLLVSVHFLHKIFSSSFSKNVHF